MKDINLKMASRLGKSSKKKPGIPIINPALDNTNPDLLLNADRLNPKILPKTALECIGYSEAEKVATAHAAVERYLKENQQAMDQKQLYQLEKASLPDAAECAASLGGGRDITVQRNLHANGVVRKKDESDPNDNLRGPLPAVPEGSQLLESISNHNNECIDMLDRTIKKPRNTPRICNNRTGDENFNSTTSETDWFPPLPPRPPQLQRRLDNASANEMLVQNTSSRSKSQNAKFSGSPLKGVVYGTDSGQAEPESPEVLTMETMRATAKRLRKLTATSAGGSGAERKKKSKKGNKCLDTARPSLTSLPSGIGRTSLLKVSVGLNPQQSPTQPVQGTKGESNSSAKSKQKTKHGLSSPRLQNLERTNSEITNETPLRSMSRTPEASPETQKATLMAMPFKDKRLEKLQKHKEEFDKMFRLSELGQKKILAEKEAAVAKKAETKSTELPMKDTDKKEDLQKKTEEPEYPDDKNNSEKDPMKQSSTTSRPSFLFDPTNRTQKKTGTLLCNSSDQYFIPKCELWLSKLFRHSVANSKLANGSQNQILPQEVLRQQLFQWHTPVPLEKPKFLRMLLHQLKSAVPDQLISDQEGAKANPENVKLPEKELKFSRNYHFFLQKYL